MRFLRLFLNVVLGFVCVPKVFLRVATSFSSESLGGTETARCGGVVD